MRWLEANKKRVFLLLFGEFVQFVEELVHLRIGIFVALIVQVSRLASECQRLVQVAMLSKEIVQPDLATGLYADARFLPAIA